MRRILRRALHRVLQRVPPPPAADHAAHRGRRTGRRVLRRDRDPRRRRRRPALPGQAGHRVLVEGADLPAANAVDGNAGTRWSSVVQRPAVDPRRPGLDARRSARSSCSGRAPTAGVPDPDLARRHRPGPPIYTTTTGAGGTADPERHRHRPLRADVRHRPRQRLRLLAVGVQGLHRRRPRPDSPRRRPDPPTRPGTWTTVWSDDFNGAANTSPVGANWLLRTGTQYPGGAAELGHRLGRDGERVDRQRLPRRRRAS